MEAVELKQTLELHEKWLAGEDGGRLADLSGSDLRGCNFRDSDLRGCDLSYSDLRGCDFRDNDLRDSNLSYSDFRGCDLRDSDLRGCNLSGSNMMANGKKCKIKKFIYLGQIYKYYCWAVEFTDGSRWIRMGCLFKSLEEWEKIGIAKSNLKEFPEDGSKASRRRVLAFEFVKESMAIEFE